MRGGLVRCSGFVIRAFYELSGTRQDRKTHFETANAEVLVAEAFQKMTAGRKVVPPLRLLDREITLLPFVKGVQPEHIEVTTDPSDTGHPCNESYLIRLSDCNIAGSIEGQSILEMEIEDSQGGMRSKVLKGDGWKEHAGTGYVGARGPGGLCIIYEPYRIYID